MRLGLRMTSIQTFGDMILTRNCRVLYVISRMRPYMSMLSRFKLSRSQFKMMAVCNEISKLSERA